MTSHLIGTVVRDRWETAALDIVAAIKRDYMPSMDDNDGGQILAWILDLVGRVDDEARFEGKSARDYFAAMALMGLSRSHAEGTVDDYQPQFVAEDCYKLADAMLAARSRGGAK